MTGLSKVKQFGLGPLDKVLFTYLGCYYFKFKRTCDITSKEKTLFYHNNWDRSFF